MRQRLLDVCDAKFFWGPFKIQIFGKEPYIPLLLLLEKDDFISNIVQDADIMKSTYEFKEIAEILIILTTSNYFF